MRNSTASLDFEIRNNMKSVMNKSVKTIGMIVVSIMLLSGCSSIHTTKTADIKKNAKLLVMPPRDVVQNGIPHVIGKGSGRQLQKSIQRELNTKSEFDVIIFEPTSEINNTITLSKDDAIAESIKLDADYCLMLTLGEFRNAAPFTFRTDFVTLDSGILIDLKTKKEIWIIDRPFMLDKSNLGNHYGLIDDIAKSVAESIVK